jgi:hypothetical protein
MLTCSQVATVLLLPLMEAGLVVGMEVEDMATHRVVNLPGGKQPPRTANVYHSISTHWTGSPVLIETPGPRRTRGAFSLFITII